MRKNKKVKEEERMTEFDYALILILLGELVVLTSTLGSILNGTF